MPQAAKAVADFIGTRHHSIEYTIEEVLLLYTLQTWIYDPHLCALVAAQQHLMLVTHPDYCYILPDFLGDGCYSCGSVLSRPPISHIISILPCFISDGGIATLVAAAWPNLYHQPYPRWTS